MTSDAPILELSESFQFDCARGAPINGCMLPETERKETPIPDMLIIVRIRRRKPTNVRFPSASLFPQ